MASDKIDSEEAVVAAFWAPLAAGFPGAFGLKDDCAAIAPEPGCDLVVTADAVIEGVHFFPGAMAHEIAWKALAVNVSDLVAKGATPFAYVMMIALPGAPERRWLAAFAEGLHRAQEKFGCRLIGGDTDRTPGPLSVSITAFGSVPAGCMVRRSTARAGDLVYVSGTIGDAALGLDHRRDVGLSAYYGRTDRFSKPVPPVALAPVLRHHVSAAMDISDGLVKDFRRLCGASGVGGRIEAKSVPLSEGALAVLIVEETSIERLITGGEDYEVLATVAPQHAADFEGAARTAGVSVTQIGVIKEAAHGVRVIDAAGKDLAFATTGWDHFAP
jgi:thiamine-monophosphate kinase